MPKTPKKSKRPSSEWARPIRELRQELGLNQADAPVVELAPDRDAKQLVKWAARRW
jgi:hypothetical protein